MLALTKKTMNITSSTHLSKHETFTFQKMAQTFKNSNTYDTDACFQRLLDLVYAAKLQSASYQQLTNFLNLKEVNSKDIVYFLGLYSRNSQRKVSDALRLEEAIKSVTLSTSNKNLDQFRECLKEKYNPTIEVSIVIPYSSTLERFRLSVTGPDWTHIDNDRDYSSNTPDGEDSYISPASLIYTLEFDNQFHPILVLGELQYESRVTLFLVVKLLDEDEYWAIFDYESDPLNSDNDDPSPIPPESRRAKFPGLNYEMSLGKLEGLFKQDNATLRPCKRTDGFYIYPATRYKGTIKPLTKDLEIAN